MKKTIQLTGSNSHELAVELMSDKSFVGLNEKDIDLKYLTGFKNIIIYDLINVGIYELIERHVTGLLIVTTETNIELDTDLKFNLEK